MVLPLAPCCLLREKRAACLRFQDLSQAAPLAFRLLFGHVLVDSQFWLAYCSTSDFQKSTDVLFLMLPVAHGGTSSENCLILLQTSPYCSL